MPHARTSTPVWCSLPDGRTVAARIGTTLLDVDHFKPINDRHGHGLGDQVLRAIATRIEQCTRLEDLTARFGGEEFVVLLPGADHATTLAAAERIRRHIAERPFSDRDSEMSAIPITVSIGVACTAPGDGPVTLDGLVQQADQATYTAKRKGRNRVEPHPSLVGPVNG